MQGWGDPFTEVSGLGQRVASSPAEAAGEARLCGGAAGGADGAGRWQLAKEACASTSSTVPTHTLALGQSQGLKKATPVLQLLAGLCFQGSLQCPGQAGRAGMPSPSGMQMGCEPQSQVGRAREAVLPFFSGVVAGGGGGSRVGPFLWLLCHPGTD